MKCSVVVKTMIAALVVASASMTVNADEASPEKKGVEIKENIRYGERRAELPKKAKDDRVLDIVYPESPAPEGGYPCLVWIHGGGFIVGSRPKGNWAPYFVKKGIAVISINYYLRRKHVKDINTNTERHGPPLIHPSRPYPESLRLAVNAAVEDADMALKWIADNAKEYRLDPKRVLIGGHSAGAITSLELAYVQRKERPVTIRGVLDFSGSVEDAKVIEAPVPPLLIVHGEEDILVGTDYGRELLKRMEALKMKCVPLIMPKVGHSVAGPALKYHSKDIFDFVDETLK